MLKAINLLGFYVKDIDATKEFYSALGLKISKEDADVIEFKLNGVVLQFISSATAKDMPEAFKNDAFGEPKGTGMYINLEVDDVDKFFSSIIGNRIKTSTEPRDWPWKQREFVVRDPDGYKLVCYQKIQ